MAFFRGAKNDIQAATEADIGDGAIDGALSLAGDATVQPLERPDRGVLSNHCRIIERSD